MRTIIWNTFKPSGKWYAGGTATIPNKHYETQEELIEAIDKGQDEVRPDSIACRQFHLVITEPNEDAKTEAKRKDFLTLMIPAKE